MESADSQEPLLLEIIFVLDRDSGVEDNVDRGIRGRVGSGGR